MTSRSNGSWAADYATMGWHVIPLESITTMGDCTCRRRNDSRCKPGKHPIYVLAPNGLENATVDTALVNRWWSSRPEANIGIVTGEPSDLYVVDVDFDKDGEETMKLLAEEYGFPRTATVRTGGGGLHLYYQHVAGLRNTQGKLGKGIDTRGDGGYVIAPPSNHKSGQGYRWVIPPDEVPPARLPEWIVAKLQQSDDVQEFERPAVSDADVLRYARTYVSKMDASVSGSNGSGALFRAAVALVKGYSLSKSDALQIILDEFNPRCTNEEGRPYPWSERDILHKLDGAEKATRVAHNYLLANNKALTKKKPSRKDSKKKKETSSSSSSATSSSSSPASSRSPASVSSEQLPTSEVVSELNHEEPDGPAFTEPRDAPTKAQPPIGWDYDSRGVFKVSKAGDRRAVSRTPMWIEGTMTSEDGMHFGVLAWRTPQGRTVRRSVPTSHFGTKSRLEGYSDLGLHITSNNSKWLVNYLSDFYYENKDLLPHCATKTTCGWHKRTAFAWGLNVVKERSIVIDAKEKPENWSHDSLMVSPEQPEMRRLLTAYERAGDFGLWKDTVGRMAFTPEMKVLFLAALGTPLLEVLSNGGVHIQNFVVDLAGITSSGKTTALRVCASIWGNPEDDVNGDPLVTTWGSTAAYIERAAAMRSGMPLMLDDTKRARMGQVPKVLYMIANGQGDGRATISSLQQKHKFRTIALSTGEGASVDMSQDGGTRVRSIILEGAPFGEPSVEMADRINELQRVCAANYGHAGPKFVQFLIANRSRLASWVERYHSLLEDKSKRAGNNGPMQRVMKIFTFVDLVEGLADQAGILPWEPDDRSLIEYLWSSIMSFVGESDRSDDAKLLVENKVIMHRSSFAAGPTSKHFNAASSGPRGCFGRWDSQDIIDRVPEVCILRSVLDDWLSHAGHTPATIYKRWRVLGVISCDEGRLTKKVRIGGHPANCVCLDEAALGLRRPRHADDEPFDEDGAP